jgi:predicted nucleic acid-binding protein
MDSNIKLYCDLIEMIEKKRNKVVQLKKEQNSGSLSEDTLLKKYDELLLEKYEKLEKLIEEEQENK